MTSLTSTQSSLIESKWPLSKEFDSLRIIALLISGSLLLTASAKLQIPFWPVPLTMQTVAVLVIAMAFGPVLGVSTVALYLLEGALGFPVFAGTPEKGMGLAYMAGPTGGYLVGFLLSAAVMGFLTRKGFDKNIKSALIAMAIGTFIIFFCGFIWLSGLIGAEKAWIFGIQPFLLGAAFKIVLAALVLPGMWKLLNRG